MRTKQSPSKTIDDYIAGFPPDVQKVLEQIRQTVRAAAPGAKETISYQMPTFSLDGSNLVYFAAHKSHIGFYPAPTGHAEFADDLARYGSGKGTLKFPLDQAMPLDLITRLVAFWAHKNQEKAAAKKRQ